MGNKLYLYEDYIINAPRELLFRWEDNIKMELREVWWGMVWIDLAQDMDRWRVLMNGIMNPRFL